MTRVEQLLADLVAIDSTNPDLVPGAAGEGAVAAFIANWLTAAGLEVHVEEVQPGREVSGRIRRTMPVEAISRDSVTK